MILGCANQAGEDNRNVARMAALLAGLPVEVAGQTVNRLCGSGLQAVIAASHAIAAGDGDVFVAGGVESMTRAPYVHAQGRGAVGPGSTAAGGHDARLAVREPADAGGLSADHARRDRGVRRRPSGRSSRERQDAFALESQRRAAVARSRRAGSAASSCRWRSRGRKGAVTIVDRDEHPRPDTTAEALAALKPAFKAGGSVTAGNSSGINDGASALLLVEAERARELGLAPMARVVATAVAGVHPDVMGIGPVPAIRKALDRAGLDVGDLDVVELNEAFASQSVACMDELGLDPARVNPNGGAIALGHPLGASGARLVTDGRPRARADRRSLRARDDVHRGGPGDRDGRGARRGLSGACADRASPPGARNPPLSLSPGTRHGRP